MELLNREKATIIIHYAAHLWDQEVPEDEVEEMAKELALSLTTEELDARLKNYGELIQRH